MLPIVASLTCIAPAERHGHRHHGRPGVRFGRCATGEYEHGSVGRRVAVGPREFRKEPLMWIAIGIVSVGAAVFVAVWWSVSGNQPVPGENTRDRQHQAPGTEARPPTPPD